MQKFDKKSIERLELYIEFLKRLVWTTGQHFPKSLGQFFFLIQIFRIVYSAVRREMCICGNAEGQREKNSGACHRLFACTPTAVLRVTTPHLVLLPLLVTSYLHLSKSVCALELLDHRISNPWTDKIEWMSLRCLWVRNHPISIGTYIHYGVRKICNVNQFMITN